MFGVLKTFAMWLDRNNVSVKKKKEFHGCRSRVFSHFVQALLRLFCGMKMVVSKQTSMFEQVIVPEAINSAGIGTIALLGTRLDHKQNAKSAPCTLPLNFMVFYFCFLLFFGFGGWE